MLRKDDKYFNTTGETPGKATKYAEKNVTQNTKILGIFKDQKRPLSASQVWEIFGMVYTPLTSMRRALSQLQTAGLLVKTEFKREGLYGRPEYYYKLLRYGSKKVGKPVK